jgi:hypothetical protein
VLRPTSSCAGALLDAFVNKTARDRFKYLLHLIAHTVLFAAVLHFHTHLPHFPFPCAGVLLDAFVNKTARERFQYLLQGMPLYVVTNTRVGIIGSREFAMRLVREQQQEWADAPAGASM